MQVSYAIGVAEPMGVYVNTYGTSMVNLTDGEIAEKVNQIFDLRPAAIISRLYQKLLSIPKQLPMDIWEGSLEKKTINFQINGETKEVEVETFTWENLEFVDK